MKKLFLLTLFCAFTIMVSAQKVARHSTDSIQFFTGTNALLEAYDASDAGDTIYLPGGSFTAPTNFEKGLIIYGAGHYPDSTTVTGKTFINGNVILRDSADNFKIEGVEITGGLTIYTGESANGVIVKRCKINSTVNVTGTTNSSAGLALIGNVIEGMIDLANAQNPLLSNNIIVTTFNNAIGATICNNVVLGYIYASYGTDYLLRANNSIINNNIFIWSTGRATGDGNSFSNNIFVAATPVYGTNYTALNNYTGIAQANIFVNQSGTAFNYEHDYHLQSPSTYPGTDSSQVGIYGGAYPYKEGAVPSNPHFFSKTIAPTTGENGMLNVQIKVSAQNN